MPVNLINEKDLNAYLERLVWNYQKIPSFFIGAKGQFRQVFQDSVFVQKNKDAVVRSILEQYMKHRMRAYLTEQEDCPFLTPITMVRSGLPVWAKKVLSEGHVVFEFKPDQVTESIHHTLILVRDFLYASADRYVTRCLRQENGQKTIKVCLDYLKTNNEYRTFKHVLALSEKWQRLSIKRVAEKAKNNQLYQASLSGIQPVMALSNGMTVCRLTTPEALDFEGECMGNCVGRGAYDDDVQKGKIQIYSIRDNKGKPHVTLEVSQGCVQQCKGRDNQVPVQRYIPVIQQFVSDRHFEVSHDIKNIGFIHQENQYYSVFDLPDGFVVQGDLDLSKMNVSSVNLNIQVNGMLDLSYSEGLPKKLDLSKVKKAKLCGLDFGKMTYCRLPLKEVDLSYCKNVPKELDLSRLKKANLSGVDLREVHLCLPQSELDLSYCQNMPELDFSSLKKVNLCGVCLTAGGFSLPREEVNLSSCQLPKRLDLSHLKKASLCHINLARKSVQWPQDEVNLAGCFGFAGRLNFARLKKVNLMYADLSGVKSIVWPEQLNTSVCLQYVIGMSPELQKSYQERLMHQQKEKGVIASVMKLFTNQR